MGFVCVRGEMMLVGIISVKGITPLYVPFHVKIIFGNDDGVVSIEKRLEVFIGRDSFMMTLACCCCLCDIVIVNSLFDMFVIINVRILLSLQ
jgi:hypothetical protein